MFDPNHGEQDAYRAAAETTTDNPCKIGEELPLPPLVVQLDRADDNLDALDSALSRLAKSLVPLLGTDPDNDTDGDQVAGGCDANPHAPLTCRVASHADRVGYLVDAVTSLSDRLEI